MKKKRLLTDRLGGLEDQILEEKAQEIADEMDAEVLRSMLCEIGWHQVIIPWVMTHEQSTEVDKWLLNRTKGRHWTRGLVFLFEDERDATWFRLTWMS